MKRPTSAFAVVVVAWVAWSGTSGRAQETPTLESRTEALLARAELTDYRGWLKFLRFEADTAVRRFGSESAAARTKHERLTEWVGRIESDAGTLAKLRGVQEWAYESPVDGTGQPFKLNIPLDYDSAKPAALTVLIHGYSGNHLEHSTGMSDRRGDFEVAVLGRARGGRYTGLSQADVLHAIDYITQHWRIDADRVRLAGGSMGGSGTLRFGARFPHRFASGQVTCGYLDQQAVGNLLTFPLYATHSTDDWIVPIVTVRSQLAALRRMGGEATFDETGGYGHAVWNYAEGNARSNAWAAHQVRRDSRQVRRIDFTALDGGAVRAWWAEIVEWGPATAPARFILTATAENTLFVELDNVGRLQLRFDEAPFDRAKPLRVIWSGAIPREIPAPLPARVVFERDGTLVAPPASTSAAASETAATPTPRLHTPGGAAQLYDGSPLLIVYGTGGDDATRMALRNAAAIASRSPNPAWLAADGPADPHDLVPHCQMLYGALRTKPDREVTETDIAESNLVLIGTPQENSVVAQLESRLPVQWRDGRIACDDGLTLPSAGRMLGLVHVNPLAPQRLILWVAAAQPSAYAANAIVPELAAGFHEDANEATSSFVGADLIIADAARRSLVLTRSFDNGWNWINGRELSPLLPPALVKHEELSRAVALAVRRATGADFAFAGPVMLLGRDAICPDVTRVVDVASLHYGHGIDVFELSGAEVLTAHARLRAAHHNGEIPCRLVPEVDRAPIEPHRLYRVAVPVPALDNYASRTQSAPLRQTRAEVSLSDALTRFLVGE